MLATIMSLSPASNMTNAGRCFDPLPLVKGNATRTTSPGSNVVIDAVAVPVAVEKLLGGAMTPIGFFGAIGQNENHVNRLIRSDLRGKVNWDLEVCVRIQFGLEF